MLIIDRYVIRQVLAPFLLGLLVFTFIFIIDPLRDYGETLVSKGVPATVVLGLMARLLPQALALTIPMSLLLALLIAFGRLSADREFVAMQACGVSLLRLLRPVGLIAAACWAATSYVLIVAMPAANQSFLEIVFDIGAQRAEGDVRPRLFFDQFPGLVLYVREVPPAGGGWKGVFIADQRGGQSPSIYLAQQGHVSIDREKRRVDMVLEHGTRHTADPTGKYEPFSFDWLALSVDATTFFGGVVSKGDNEMTIAELRARIVEQEKALDSTHNQWMAIHRKFSIPVACLVFGLIGLALGATHRRDGTLGSFVLGLVVIFAYYLPLALGPQLAKGRFVPPWLAVWMPNLILGAVGIMMFVWRDRVADQPIRLPVPAFLRHRSSVGVVGARLPLLSILDRYVTATYTRFLFLSAAALAAIFYIATFIDLSDKLFKGTVTWTMLGQYFWFATPQYVYYIVPLSVLLAALVTTAIFTKNSELIVMKACGISLYRIACPMFVVAVLAGGVLFALDEAVLGPANQRAEAINDVMRGRLPETPHLLNRRWVVGSGGEIYHYDQFNPRTRQLTGLSIYEFADGMQRLTRWTFAEQATYVGPREGDEATTWKVERGWTREFNDRGVGTAFTPFTSATEPIETAAYFGTEQPNPKFMGYKQLSDYATLLKASGFNVLEQQVALARKVSFPFVTLVMTLIAVPFGVTIGRSGAMGGIGAGVALAIVYWITFTVFTAIGTGGMIAPGLAAWAPNLLFGAGAAYLLLTVRT